MKTSKILFLGFKNRASITFASPLISHLLKTNNNSNYSLCFALSPSLLIQLLNQGVLNEFTEFINLNSFKVILTVPGVDDLYYNFTTNSKYLSLVKIFIINYLLIIPSFIYYFCIYKKITNIITYKNLVKINNFSICLIAGTHHISSHFLLSRFFLNTNSKLKFIWLPHAPHQSGLITKIPQILHNTYSYIDYWLPIPEERLSSEEKLISHFTSGYPPFISSELTKQNRLIYKKPLISNKPNLIIILRRVESKGSPAQTYTYDFNQTISTLFNLNEFVNTLDLSSLLFCVHPSTNLSYLNTLIQKFTWPKYSITYDYFTKSANKNTFVIGSYSSVLLHSALLGLPTICLNDHIIKYI